MHDIEDKKITIFQKKLKFEIKFFTDTMDIRVIKKIKPQHFKYPPPKKNKTTQKQQPQKTVHI